MGAGTTVGVISDTHGLVRPEAVSALAGVDLLIHAGDVGDPEVLEALAAVAPLTVVRGNNDHGGWADVLPETATLEVGGATLFVIHDRAELPRDFRADRVHAVIAGHSHRPSLERVDGCLHLNPGSAGPRRFTLPVAVARLTVHRGTVEAEILELDV